MKVLQINSVCGYGSTGRITTDLDKVIKANGFDSFVAYGRGDSPSDVSVIRIGDNIDIYNHIAMTRLFDMHGFGSKNSTIRFIEQVERYNPDIIHMHNLHGYFINIQVLFKYLRRSWKPIIWTLHDCWSFTGHCAHFDYIGCEKWKTGCYNCPQTKRYPASVWLDCSRSNWEKKKELFTGLNSLTIVTPSQWLANLVKDSFLGSYPVKVIYNGIDLSVYQPSDSSTLRKQFKIEGKFIILGVASVWDQHKGLDSFLKLSTLICSEMVIVLVGLSGEQIKELPSNIIGIKRTNSVSELAQLYSMADVFVNPTLEEVFGLVNAEALACGTPVITFNTGGSVESVDGNCGYVVKKNDLHELLNAIKNVRKNGKLSYHKSCVRRAQKNYDKNERYNSYVQLYSGMMHIENKIEK